MTEGYTPPAVRDLTEDAMNRAWIACLGGPQDLPQDILVGHSTHRIMVAFRAYPRTWKRFLAGLDATERHLAAKYRWRFA